jgi:signal transduction histidine kinase
VKYHVLVIKDVTERKQLQDSLQRALEAAEEGNRAKTEFLANMSHEMRTPLAGVLGMIELVQGMEIGEEERHLLETAANSGRSILRLVQDLLDFSSIEAGRMSLEQREFEVRKCVAAEIEAIRPAAEKKGIPVTLAVSDAVPATVSLDESRVRQVLVNLLGNAVKFTERGKIEVTVTLNSDGGLLFCVSDTGIGIPPGKMKRLFRVFSQANSSTTRKYGGTGLGLALSREDSREDGRADLGRDAGGEGERVLFYAAG